MFLARVCFDEVKKRLMWCWEEKILECDDGSGLVHWRSESKKHHNNRVLAVIVVLSLSLCVCVCLSVDWGFDSLIWWKLNLTHICQILNNNQPGFLLPSHGSRSPAAIWVPLVVLFWAHWMRHSQSLCPLCCYFFWERESERIDENPFLAENLLGNTYWHPLAIFSFSLGDLAVEL